MRTTRQSSRGAREKSGDYEVGYGKPPVNTRFKPGQSGNPKGRPRGSKSFASLMRAALSETVQVREDGRLRHISRREAIIKSLIARALKGDARANDRLLSFMQQLYPERVQDIKFRVEFVGEDDGNAT